MMRLSQLSHPVSLLVGLGTLWIMPAVVAQQAGQLTPLQGWQEGRPSSDLGSLLNGNQGGSVSLPSLMNQIRNMDGRNYSEVAQDQMENLNSEAANFRQRQLQLHNQPEATPAP